MAFETVPAKTLPRRWAFSGLNTATTVMLFRFVVNVAVPVPEMSMSPVERTEPDTK